MLKSKQGVKFKIKINKILKLAVAAVQKIGWSKVTNLQLLYLSPFVKTATGTGEWLFLDASERTSGNTKIVDEKSLNFEFFTRKDWICEKVTFSRLF